MPTENDNERIRQAAERSTPPLPPEVRKRALWAVMTAMRRRPPLRTALLVSLGALLLAAAVYVVVRCSVWRQVRGRRMVDSGGDMWQIRVEGEGKSMLLGELLVNRYRLISKEQCREALERQTDPECGRRLGEILIEMGLITQEDLEEALDYQLSQSDPWKGAP
jgi:hypothetical protein